MPKNSAQWASECPILSASKPPCAKAAIIPSASPGAFVGEAPSVAASVEDHLAQPSLVVEPERSHDGSVRVHRADQSLPLQRHPDCRIAQPAGVASCDHGVAEVKMITMRIGRPYNYARLVGWPGVSGLLRELLQQG